jgi:hypothetical protein
MALGVINNTASRMFDSSEKEKATVIRTFKKYGCRSS